MASFKFEANIERNKLGPDKEFGRFMSFERNEHLLVNRYASEERIIIAADTLVRSVFKR